MHDEFQNVVSDGMVKFCNFSRLPDNYETNILYDGIMLGSPGRRLVVDLYCWYGRHHLNPRSATAWMDKHIENVSTELMQGCVRALLGKRACPTGLEPWKKDAKAYHAGSYDKDGRDQESWLKANRLWPPRSSEDEI